MKTTTSFLAGLLIATLAIPASAQLSGALVFDTIQFDGLQRSYIMFVPASYDGSEAVPLVLNLHGAGSTAIEQVVYSQLNNVADTAGFLVLIPDAVDNFWSSGFSFLPAGAPDDVAFLLGLLDTVSSQYSIDPNRVYSTGMSNGGFMSYRLACEAADRFAAIASVTGSMADLVYSDCSPSRVVPVMEVHGTSDLTVPYEGSATSTGIPDVVEFWRAHNDCPETPEIFDFPDLASEGCTVQQQRYFPCQDWSEMLLLKVDGGGHTWPGSFPLPGAGCTNQDIRANAEVWKFFLRHNLADRFTGVENQLPNMDRSLEVHPNPATTSIWLSGQVGSLYRIFDSMGRLVDSGSLMTGQQSLSTEDWIPGMYVIESANGKATRLMVIR